MAWHVQSIGDGNERHFIGRRNDGAKYEGNAPAHAGNDRVRDDRDATVVRITNPNAIWKIQIAFARNSLVGAVTLSQ